MRTIALTQGAVAVVDDEDYELFASARWCVKRAGFRSYAVRSPGHGQRHIFMHRVVLGLAPSDRRPVDHVNGDGLDNRKANLRLATTSQNAANKRKSSGSSSRYKGVYWHTARARWEAGIEAEGRRRYLGRFDTEDAAARAYDAAAKASFGEFARTNFP